jgi:hypothetical protein
MFKPIFVAGVLLVGCCSVGRSQAFDWASTNSLGQTETGVLVQEAPATDNVTAFWGGFVLIFMAGMTASGARWVKKIIGGVHEAGE